jgi:hypothetical protein
MAFGGVSRRDDRFDFLRGLALLVIFIDHVPKNLFEPVTLHSFAFCDAAEVFFFISGYVAALVYGGVLLKTGFAAAVRKVWRRACVVYSFQWLLTAVVLALVWIFLTTSGDETFRWSFRVQWVYEDPLAYVIPAITMQYQPGYLDILPAYVVLLAAFPAVLWLMTKNVWYVLVPSFLLWLTVQLTGLSLWTTNGERWFFNPYAWQFLFVIGASFGHPAMRGKFGWLDNRWLFRAAVLISIPVALIQMGDTLSHYITGLNSFRPNTMMLDKPCLGVLRLISFFALALIVRRFIPESGVLSAKGWTCSIVRTGSFSLQVFSFGCVLSSLTAVTWILLGPNYPVQSVETVIGVLAQIGFAAWLYRRKNGEGRSAPVAGEAPVPVLPPVDPA